MSPFAITYTQFGGVVVVEPTGEIDLATSDQFRDALFDHMRTGTDAVILRLDRVDFLDSTGITAIVSAYKHAQVHRIEFCLAAPSGVVARALEVTGLPKAIPVYADLDAATDAVTAAQS